MGGSRDCTGVVVACGCSRVSRHSGCVAGVAACIIARQRYRPWQVFHLWLKGEHQVELLGTALGCRCL